MQKRTSCGVVLGVSCGLLVLLASGLPLVDAQVQVGDADKLGGDELGAFNASAHNNMSELLRGQKPLTEDGKKLIDLAARHYIYRVTWWDRIQPHRKEMLTLHREFDQDTKVAQVNLDKNKDARKVFAEKLIGCFKQVFNLPGGFDKNRVACVNAAVMLPQLARLKQDEIADFMVELIADPKKHDSIKLYALRSLPEVFPAEELTIANRNRLMAKKPIYVKRIDALVSFIERKYDPARGDKEAFCYLRQEAIKALAQAGIPAVEADPKTQKIDGPVVYELLRVLAEKPILDPPPTFEERFEAAIGLCQLKYPASSSYRPAVAIHRVGRFVQEFIKGYQVDFNEFSGKKGRIPVVPWKADADRLQYGLKKLVENSQFDPNLADLNEQAQKLEKAATSYLGQIKTYNAERNIGRIDDLTGLTQGRPAPPKTLAVYPTIKKEPAIGD